MKPSGLSRREWARLVAAAPLAAAPAAREHTLANQALEFAIGIGSGRLLSRRVKNRLTGETASLPAEEFAFEFEGGYKAASSQMKVEVSGAGASGLTLLFTGERLQVRVARQLSPGKAYLRKQLSVRTLSGPPMRLLRAELDDWRGARGNWKSMTADRVRYGSHPIYCESFWAGVEFVAAFNEYGPEGFLLCSRPGGRQVGGDWTALRPTVCGVSRPGAVRDAFLAYLEDVRLAPPRMTACYNSWWTLPKVVVQKDNLALIRELKAAMYDPHGVFFDIITTDMGWSNPRSIWELDRSILPQGFDDIRAVVEPAGGRLGLWMSPSECYPPVCDYEWAEKNGYVVVRAAGAQPRLSLADPRYREETKAALRKLIRENKLAHIKYDGFVAEEDRPHHGLLPGIDSVEPLAEYSLELLRASKQENPGLITEPTYMNSWANYISPWILMYSDTIWGNSGGDLPPGMTPAPDYREAATTAREWYIFSSLNEVWAPQNALHYFDIVHVDAREGFPNHAAMAFGAGDSYKALSRAFEARYPGVRVEAFRAGGSDLVVRMSEEAKARRPTMDALETTYDNMLVARANNLIRPYNSPFLTSYPAEAKEKADAGLTFWTIFRESYMGFGYSKDQLPGGAVPKNFDGLFQPQLKGKMGLTLNESSARMIGAMIKVKGEAFVKKLKSQQIRVFTVSSAALVDLMASGELGASFHIYRNHAMVSAERGSAVSWVPMELVPTNSGSVALSAQPPHPYAATLFGDFLLGAEARSVLEKFQYGHPSNQLAFKRWHPGFGRSLEQFEKDSEKWEKLAKEITQR